MKEIMAIIRMNMMNQTKQALSDAGISSFTATGRVVGRGKGKVDRPMLGEAVNGYDEAVLQPGREPRLYPKRLLTVVVPDHLARMVVDTLIAVNRTGQPGDGKIFVLPVSEAYRIRTGETGDGILDN